MGHKKKRVDSNQKEIIKGLTERYGKGAVVPLSTVGEGVPDLLVGVGNVNLLMEVKTDTGKLTPSQVDWHKQWQGQVAIVRSVDEAVAVIDAVGRG